jgi:quercetin dioxygenase-like cupin family protein
MLAAASGPLHTLDREQTVVVLDGELEVTIDGATHHARPGDSVTIPAGALRQLANRGASTLVTVTAALPGAVARVPDGDEVLVPWAQ